MDIDLEKFFDRVNHEHPDGAGGQAGVRSECPSSDPWLPDRGCARRRAGRSNRRGNAAGRPLSPLLSNLLDELDKELERRNHRFVRYADDCNIYVRSARAGERVTASVERFLAASDAEGQHAEERGRPAAPAQVPRLQLHEREDAKASDRTAGCGPVQGARAGVDDADAGREPRSDSQGAVALSEGWRGCFGFC
ncbi:reverse transcriptase domain-containing protein [Mesorhizobium muleiense]|uniref:reverse transcriptase domain-containing protein n=1 Tax=Mesorhizobium muleiense TaxID=1004279 RepID=UPI003AFA3B84